MSQAATQIAIKNKILNNARALGNSNRGFKEVASDLCNQYGRKHAGIIAEGTFLSKVTVLRVMDLEEGKSGCEYHPNSDTLERIFRYFGARVEFNTVTVQERYKPQPKEL